MPRYKDRYDHDDRYDRYGRRASNTKLYVAQISPHTQTHDLEDLFSKYGRLRSVDLKTDFGFVEFYDPRDADYARYDLDGQHFGGSRIIVAFARGVPRGPGGVRQYGSGPPVPGRCFNCGIDGHWVRDCKAGDWRNRCFRCGEMGHIERNCQNSPKDMRRERNYSMSPSPRHGKGRGRSYSRSPSPRHGKGQGRSYSRSPSPHRGRGFSKSRCRRYSRSLSPRRDNRNAGGGEMPSRSPGYSHSPRSPPPRERPERSGSYHGRSPRRGEARGKWQSP